MGTVRYIPVGTTTVYYPHKSQVGIVLATLPIQRLTIPFVQQQAVPLLEPLLKVPPSPNKNPPMAGRPEWHSFTRNNSPQRAPHGLTGPPRATLSCVSGTQHASSPGLAQKKPPQTPSPPQFRIGVSGFVRCPCPPALSRNPARRATSARPLRATGCPRATPRPSITTCLWPPCPLQIGRPLTAGG